MLLALQVQAVAFTVLPMLFRLAFGLLYLAVALSPLIEAREPFSGKPDNVALAFDNPGLLEYE